jgi:hydrogenase maturation protease
MVIAGPVHAELKYGVTRASTPRSTLHEPSPNRRRRPRYRGAAPSPGIALDGVDMTHLAPPSVRLLVCGNADRGDDGAALSAVATLLPTLQAALLERLEVRRCGQLRVEDLLDVTPGEVAIVVDAAVNVPPGHVVSMPISEIASAAGTAAPRSSHDLPIDQVLALAGTLRVGGLPAGTFIGIGGRRFGYGRPLSRSVRLAMPGFQRAIAAELARLAHVPG